MTVARMTSVTLAYGDHVAVRGIDLEVADGQVVALVGGDGAGKTTTLRALAGRVTPRSGRLERPDRERVGVVPEVGATWRDLTVAENLAFVRQAFGGDPAFVTELVRRMQLEGARDRLAGDLSGGMRQKLALAMALQHRPELLVLDEPTTGVDPVSRAEIWRLLGEELANGTAVVLATTYLDEAARATTTVLLDAGDVLASGSPAAVVASTPGVVVRSDHRLGAASWRRGRRWHTWLPDGDVGDVVAEHGAERVDPDLEDAAVVRALAHEAARREQVQP